MSGDPFLAGGVLNCIQDLIGGNGSNASSGVSEVGADLLGLASCSSLELAAQSFGDVTVTAGAAVLPEACVALYHCLARSCESILNAKESRFAITVSHARFSLFFCPKWESIGR